MTMTPYNPKRKGHMDFNEQAEPAFADVEPIDLDDKADTEERENQDLLRTQIKQNKKNRVKL